MRPLTKEEWKKRRKRKKYIKLSAILALMSSVIILFLIFIKLILSFIFPESSVKGIQLESGKKVEQMFLTPSKYSRSEIKLEKVKGIVIHYVGNSGMTAREERDYYESLKDTKKTAASSHFVIGLQGEIIQCIPMDEIAYASKDRNMDTISIEFCHENVDGKPTEATYESLVELCAYISEQYDLKTTEILRHYDVTGKVCPKYYVDDEEAWNTFLEDVQKKISKNE